MGTTTLKEKVIERIRKLENENLVSEIYALLQLETDDPEIYTLSDAQIAVIEEAQAQYKKGEYMTDAQAQKDFEEWRKK